MFFDILDLSVCGAGYDLTAWEIRVVGVCIVFKL